MSQGDSALRFDAERFAVDIRVWMAVNRHSARATAAAVPSGAAQISRLQRGMCEPHAGLFLALCDLMGLDPMAYYVKATP